jgi:sugar-phosphatase
MIASRAMTLRPAALLLDMDGLMVDSEPLWFEVERDFARSRGGDWTPELAHACVGQGLRHTLDVMRDTFGFAIDEARDTRDVIDRFLARVGSLVLKPGCEELLAQANGHVPMALASSSSRRLVEGVVARFGLGAILGAVVSGDDVARPKPAPDIFLEAARRLGAPAEQCVVLEDSLAGVAAARAAGMHAIAVPERSPEPFHNVTPYVVGDLFAARALLTW